MFLREERHQKTFFRQKILLGEVDGKPAQRRVEVDFDSFAFV